MKDNVLKIIADNPALQSALKELFERHFNDLVVNLSQTDEELGQMTRARLFGLHRLGLAFQEIGRHKTPVEKPAGENPAR